MGRTIGWHNEDGDALPIAQLAIDEFRILDATVQPQNRSAYVDLSGAGVGHGPTGVGVGGSVGEGGMGLVGEPGQQVPDEEGDIVMTPSDSTHNVSDLLKMGSHFI